MKRTRYNRKPAAMSLPTTSMIDSLATLQQKRSVSPSSLANILSPLPAAKHTLQIRSFSALITEDDGNVYLVIKNATSVAEVVASFDMNKATLTAQLMYDIVPPKQVDYVRKPPLESFVHISELDSREARIESQISVLTSQHEDSLFRIRFTAITPESTIVDALSPPIKVISKADSRMRYSTAALEPPLKRRRTASKTAATPTAPSTTATPPTISQHSTATHKKLPTSQLVASEMSTALAALAKAVIAVPPESRICELRQAVDSLPQPDINLLLNALSGAYVHSPVIYENSDTDSETPRAYSAPPSPEEDSHVRDVFFSPHFGVDLMSSWV